MAAAVDPVDRISVSKPARDLVPDLGDETGAVHQQGRWLARVGVAPPRDRDASASMVDPDAMPVRHVRRGGPRRRDAITASVMQMLARLNSSSKSAANNPDRQITARFSAPSVKPRLKKYSGFQKSQISSLSRHPAPWEGVAQRHETRSGMRWTRALRLTGDLFADGEVVWF